MIPVTIYSYTTHVCQIYTLNDKEQTIKLQLPGSFWTAVVKLKSQMNRFSINFYYYYFYPELKVDLKDNFNLVIMNNLYSKSINNFCMLICLSPTLCDLDCASHPCIMHVGIYVNLHTHVDIYVHLHTHRNQLFCIIHLRNILFLSIIFILIMWLQESGCSHGNKYFKHLPTTLWVGGCNEK